MTTNCVSGVEDGDFGISLLLTVDEGAVLLRVGRTTIYGLMMCGKIPSVTIGRRRLIVRAGLEEFVLRLQKEQD